MFSGKMKEKSEENFEYNIQRLKDALEMCDCIVIGAGAGLSTAAGFVYTGERFEKYFSDFGEKYGFHDMYSGGFYPYKTLNEHWAYWSRYIYVNRFMDPPKQVYSMLFDLVKDKDYFVLTTNVDHCFQKAGFDKKRLFYTQGDYGLFQCSVPCKRETVENEELVKEMLISQGFGFSSDGSLVYAQEKPCALEIPDGLIPRCPNCGKPLTMNLRADDTFAEDEGWHLAAERYSLFMRRHEGMKILFLELGVGYNTPVIIKYQFWRQTDRNKNAVYACINFGEAAAPGRIQNRSICINEDIERVLELLMP